MIGGIRFGTVLVLDLVRVKIDGRAIRVIDLADVRRGYVIYIL